MLKPEALIFTLHDGLRIGFGAQLIVETKCYFVYRSRDRDSFYFDCLFLNAGVKNFFLTLQLESLSIELFVFDAMKIFKIKVVIQFFHFFFAVKK